MTSTKHVCKDPCPNKATFRGPCGRESWGDATPRSTLSPRMKAGVLRRGLGGCPPAPGCPPSVPQPPVPTLGPPGNTFPGQSWSTAGQPSWLSSSPATRHQPPHDIQCGSPRPRGPISLTFSADWVITPEGRACPCAGSRHSRADCALKRQLGGPCVQGWGLLREPAPAARLLTDRPLHAPSSRTADFADSRIPVTSQEMCTCSLWGWV